MCVKFADRIDTANDPINNTDPSGNELVVVGDEKFQTQVSNMIATIAATPEGEMAVNQLNATSYKITIKPSDANKYGDKTNRTVPDSGRDATNGRGTGSTVKFNPSIKEGGADINGDTSRPPVVGLAHELGHALDSAAGKQSFDKQLNTDGTPKFPGTTPPSEQGSSVTVENAVRQHLKLAPRGPYYPKEEKK